jgi:hypothetical protein
MPAATSTTMSNMTHHQLSNMEHHQPRGNTMCYRFMTFSGIGYDVLYCHRFYDVYRFVIIIYDVF